VNIAIDSVSLQQEFNKPRFGSRYSQEQSHVCQNDPKSITFVHRLSRRTSAAAFVGAKCHRSSKGGFV
jgi:hypothetical protein